MYEIKAKLIADRINISRGGARARRLPSIVLATGAVLRIAPGRSVRVTEQVYEANRALLDSFAGVIDIIDHREITPPAPIPPEPTEEEKPKRRRSKPKPAPEPEPVSEPETIPAPEPEPVITPDPEPVEEEKPKRTRRSRRKKTDDA
jgi:outer membrane biosynthesis protein TonB